ncbi:MAG: hypothetical protein QW112_03790 [Candidatus Micrarchaeia archaeon]
MGFLSKPKDSVEEVTDATLEKGGVLALLYFDAHGNTQDEVEGLLVNIGESIAKEPGVVYAVSEIYRALEMSDKLFSSGAKVKILTDSFASLARICGRYGPMGVEVLKPDEIRLRPDQAHDILFTISEMSHEFTTSMIMKLLKPEERAALGEKLRRRAEMGKRLMEESQKGEKKEEKG